MRQLIVFKGIDFEAEFEYQPFEPAERGPEAQYPGCHEYVEEVTSLTHKGSDFLELIYEDNEEEIDSLILRAMRDY